MYSRVECDFRLELIFGLNAVFCVGNVQRLDPDFYRILLPWWSGAYTSDHQQIILHTLKPFPSVQ